MTRYEQDPLDGLCFEDILEWVPRISVSQSAPLEEDARIESSRTAQLVRELLLEVGTAREPEELEVTQRRVPRSNDRTQELDDGDLEPLSEPDHEPTEPPVPSRRAAGILAVLTLLLLLGALIHVTAPDFHFPLLG